MDDPKHDQIVITVRSRLTWGEFRDAINRAIPENAVIDYMDFCPGWQREVIVNYYHETNELTVL